MSLKVEVKDIAGKPTGTIDLPASRAGTHKTKNRGEVSGGGKKPFKQKGTGRARQGSTRSPNQRHGGVAHGPVPRKYDQRTPKKMIAAALKGVLSDRQRATRIHAVSGIVEATTTKAAIAAVRQFSDRKNLLVVLSRTENAAWLHLIVNDQLNAYDVLVSDDVIFSEGALRDFIAGPATGKGATAVARESEVGASA
jgi:large subunit ribosomal protein L4